MLYPSADALDDLAQLLAGDGDKSFETQYVVRGDRGADASEEIRRIGDRSALDDEALEIVVIMRLPGRVMRRAVGEIVLGRRGEAEEQCRRQRAMRRLDQLDGRAQPRFERPTHLAALRRIEQIALVEEDQVRAGQLVRKAL